jgi:hypothetical protein
VRLDFCARIDHMAISEALLQRELAPVARLCFVFS